MLRSLMVTLIILAAIPLIMRLPHIGVLVWTWISYMYPHRMVYGFASYFPFLDIIALLTAFSWLISRDPKRLPAHVIWFPLGLFFLWLSFTTVASLDVEVSMVKYVNVAKTLLYTVFLMGLITTQTRLQALIYVICASLGYLAVKGGVFTLMTGGGYQVMGPPGSFIEDRNNLAMVLVMLIPLLRYVTLHGPNKWVRLLAWGAMGATVVAVFGTQSRGGLVALLVVASWLGLMSRHRIGFAVAGVVAAVVAFSFMPDSWRERMQTIGEYQADGSAQGRMQMWRYAMDVAESRPLSGGGFRVFFMPEVAAGYLPENVPLRASHSIYFEVLGEHGYVGLFLFLFLMASGFFTFRATQALCRNRAALLWAKDLSIMGQASIVSFAIGGAFLEVAFAEIFFHLMAIAAILHLVVQRQLADAAAPAERTDPLRSAGALSPAE